MFAAHRTNFGSGNPANHVVSQLLSKGATVSGTQRNAIKDFFETGVSEGWLSSIKRLYLPIWGVEAANAVDWIELGSGTFNGTVTHGAGFVQGDGSTGYFEIGNFTELGLTAQDAATGCLLKSPTLLGQTTALISNHVSGTEQFDMFQSVSQLRQNDGDSSLSHSIAKSNQVGILGISSKSGTSYIFQRTTTGASTLESGASAGGTTPNVKSNAMRSLFGGGGAYSDAEFGSVFQAIGMTPAVNSQFTAALKTLWETATGLTIP